MSVTDEEKPRHLPVAQAAARLKCCRETLYNLEKRKQLRMVRPFGRTMVPISEIERLERGEVMQPPVGEPVGEPKLPRIAKRQLNPQLM